jgi:hypothetical protein
MGGEEMLKSQGPHNKKKKLYVNVIKFIFEAVKAICVPNIGRSLIPYVYYSIAKKILSCLVFCALFS